MEMLKSASEDQMDMLMMMQIEKISELCSDIPRFSSLASDTSNINVVSNLHDHQYQNSHFLINPPIQSSSSSNIINPQFNHQNYFHPSSQFNSNNNNYSSTYRAMGEYNATSTSQKRNSMAAMREMIFRIAAMQPIHIDPETVKAPKRRNVKISKDPQSVAARHRRERISERIRILQRLVPGGTKMDTASMLDEAVHYVKFLKSQVQSLERVANGNNSYREELICNNPMQVVFNSKLPFF